MWWQGHSGWVCLGMVAWWLAACSGSGPAPDDDPLSRANYCARYAALACTTYVECDCASSQDACTKSVRAECEDFSGNQLASGYAFDPTLAEQCLDDLEHAFRDCRVVDATRPHAYQFCQAFRGNEPEGADCTYELDCEQPEGTATTCILDQPDGRGLCDQTPLATLGGECNPDGFYPPFCVDGLWCSPESSHCEVPREVGESCESAALYFETVCAEGLYCSPSTTTCAEPAGAGEPCEKYFERSSCVPGYDCRNVEEVCQPSAISRFVECE
jgi:hypothetical protein